MQLQLSPNQIAKEAPQKSDGVEDFVPQVKLYLGVPGSGKTYLIKSHVKELLYRYSTIERDSKKQITSYRGPSLLVLSPTREWVEVPGLDLPIQHYTDTTKQADFESYPFWRVDNVQTMFRIAQPDTIIVLEELLCISEKFHGLIQEKLALHRHLHLTILLSTQRPRCIPRAGLALATKIYLFKLSDGDDSRVLKSYLSEQQQNILPRLSRGQFLALSPGITDERKTVTP